MIPEILLYGVVNILCILAHSPLFVSLIRKVKAWTQGRKGPSIFQTYYTIAKLVRKEVLYSHDSSRIMRVTSWVNIAAVLVAALFAVKSVLVCGAIEIFESSMAKMRFFKIPGLFAMAFFFSTITIIIEVLT